VQETHSTILDYMPLDFAIIVVSGHKNDW